MPGFFSKANRVVGKDTITSKVDFERINKAMLEAIQAGELVTYTYALLYDERSWSLDAITYYRVQKESIPEVNVQVNGSDQRLRKIGLLPVYLYLDY